MNADRTPRRRIPRKLEVRYGTPSAEEWCGLWLCDEQTRRHTEEEFDAVYRSFEERLAALGKVGYEDGNDFYFRGDDYGDRTQYLEIVNSAALTLSLLKLVQKWLREPDYRWWRIVTSNYLGPDGAIMVYPTIIRVSRKYHGDVGGCVEGIVARRLAGERH
jgi:hypothetical protein